MRLAVAANLEFQMEEAKSRLYKRKDSDIRLAEYYQRSGPVSEPQPQTGLYILYIY